MFVPFWCACDAGAQEGHCTASASGAGGDVGRGRGVGGVGRHEQRDANARGYVRGEDMVEQRLRAWADRIDWGGGGGVVVAGVQEPRRHSEDGGQLGVP